MNESWWKNTEALERVNWLFSKTYARVVTRDSEGLMKGLNLYEVKYFTIREKIIRMTTDDGVGYYDYRFYQAIVDVFRPENWYLTQTRLNKKYNMEYRLLAGEMKNGKYILLSPIKDNSNIEELFKT
jgi:hypothetical protein